MDFVVEACNYVKFACMHNFLELDSFLVQQLDHLLLIWGHGFKCIQ